MAFPSSITNEIHVLLVESDTRDHDNIKIMLDHFSYKVTATKHASTAVSVWTKGKSQIDILMINMNSLDSYGFGLLQDAIKMNLLVILMLEEDDPNTTMWALESGAFLSITKPIMMQSIGCLWQHVLREKTIRFKENERHRMVVVENNGLNNDIGGDLTEHSNGNVTYKRKVWTEWTQELHDKFMNAVTELGEGRCYPKEILELMGVPGLTRMQVASHLQRCRGGNWLPPNERKSKVASAEMTTARKKAPRAKHTRFGLMPRSRNIFKPHLSMQDYQNTSHQEVNFDSFIENNTLADNLDGSSIEIYHPQCQVQPQNYSIYPFAHETEGEPEPTLGKDISLSIDETSLFGAQNVESIRNTTFNQQRDNTNANFEFPYMDCFSSLEQELLRDYNGSLGALVLDQEYFNQKPSMANASTNQWSQNIPKLRNGKQSDGNMTK